MRIIAKHRRRMRFAFFGDSLCTFASNRSRRAAGVRFGVGGASSFNPGSIAMAERAAASPVCVLPTVVFLVLTVFALLDHEASSLTPCPYAARDQVFLYSLRQGRWVALVDFGHFW